MPSSPRPFLSQRVKSTATPTGSFQYGPHPPNPPPLRSQVSWSCGVDTGRLQDPSPQVTPLDRLWYCTVAHPGQAFWQVCTQHCGVGCGFGEHAVPPPVCTRALPNPQVWGGDWQAPSTARRPWPGPSPPPRPPWWELGPREQGLSKARWAAKSLPVATAELQAAAAFPAGWCWQQSPPLQPAPDKWN